MKTNRRKFISSAVAGGLGAASIPLSSFASSAKSLHGSLSDLNTRYDYLDEALKKPVFRKELFPTSVVIESIELLRDRSNFLCRVRSKDGAIGISAGHGSQNKSSWPVMDGLIKRFVGKDARDLDSMIPGDSGKSGGVPFNAQVATLEFAILDMMGNTAKKPVGELLGTIHHPMISVYQGSRVSELRLLPPEESLEIVKKDLLESKAKAIKMRAGKTGVLDGENAPGRTEKLIKMAREMFGNDMVLGCDGNGNYSKEGGIRMGKVLEEYNYSWWEEMVPFGHYDQLKQVKDNLRIPISTGESESYISTFRWLIANDACDIVQPDTTYFGGMIRSMKVARMAAVFGKTIVPHITQYGLGYIYMLHLVSACPNAGKYQEFDLFSTRDANGDNIPIEYKSGDPITSYDGVLKVPTGSGLGIVIDPDYIKKHKVVNSW